MRLVSARLEGVLSNSAAWQARIDLAAAQRLADNHFTALRRLLDRCEPGYSA
jgi:hypothetical protein